MDIALNGELQSWRMVGSDSEYSSEKRFFSSRDNIYQLDALREFKPRPMDFMFIF